jgi:hypothetical protein
MFWRMVGRWGSWDPTHRAMKLLDGWGTKILEVTGYRPFAVRKVIRSTTRLE